MAVASDLVHGRESATYYTPVDCSAYCISKIDLIHLETQFIEIYALDLLTHYICERKATKQRPTPY